MHGHTNIHMFSFTVIQLLTFHTHTTHTTYRHLLHKHAFCTLTDHSCFLNTITRSACLSVSHAWWHFKHMQSRWLAIPAFAPYIPGTWDLPLSVVCNVPWLSGHCGSGPHLRFNNVAKLPAITTYRWESENKVPCNNKAILRTTNKQTTQGTTKLTSRNLLHENLEHAILTARAQVLDNITMM